MRDRNQVVLPINLGIKTDEKDPVRQVVEICEGLDYTELENTYLRTWRKVNPRTMFMLHMIFSFTLSKGFVRVNPMVGVEKISQDNKSVDYLDMRNPDALGGSTGYHFAGFLGPYRYKND